MTAPLLINTAFFVDAIISHVNGELFWQRLRKCKGELFFSYMHFFTHVYGSHKVSI